MQDLVVVVFNLARIIRSIFASPIKVIVVCIHVQILSRDAPGLEVNLRWILSGFQLNHFPPFRDSPLASVRYLAWSIHTT